ncbi:MAG: hypothetical protein U5R06_13105 [candidate division KSB1 bacterium]|nr:hypothetical protein [candidate division KSB1 bacterium]
MTMDLNTVSTFGNLLRLMAEEQIEYNPWERRYYELALKLSAAVQAGRWTQIENGGFMYSFNGPHSLFVDTVRTCRILMLGHALGHYLPGEHDEKISLLNRALQHLESTARYCVFYGQGRDRWVSVYGRTAHECIFNINDDIIAAPIVSRGIPDLPPGRAVYPGGFGIR